MSADTLNLPFRQGVGLCIFNAQGLVLSAERRDRAGAWQMPQGGVQKGEDPLVAALREMKEEVGTDKAEIIGIIPHKLSYVFPDFMQYRNGVFHGKYRGQEQIWLALRYLGTDADINLSGADDPEPAEFVAWRWMPLEEAPGLIVDFKRPAYEEVVAAFAPLSEALARGETPPVLRNPVLPTSTRQGAGA